MGDEISPVQSATGEDSPLDAGSESESSRSWRIAAAAVALVVAIVAVSSSS